MKSIFVLESDLTAAQFSSKIVFARGRDALIDLAQHVQALASGSEHGLIDAKIGAEHATATVTLTGLPSADEILTVANVVLTAKTSGATGPQFNIGSDATATAAAIAACINAQAALQDIVSATSEAGVVTITSHLPAKMANGLQLSEGLSNATVTKAFSDGADGTKHSIDAR